MEEMIKKAKAVLQQVLEHKLTVDQAWEELEKLGNE